MSYKYNILSLDEDKIIEEISNFAVHLGKRVYVVGGAVRDALLNRKTLYTKDVDLAGNLTIEELIELLKSREISFEIKNRRLEVLSFDVLDVHYEYARLRREQYLDKDTHTPTIVQFVDEVDEDARRRDFTVNSVYYDRHSSSILDPLGGVQDIKDRIVRPVLGEDTFKVDPARIIRFVELVCRFQLNVQEEVFSWAKKYSQNVYRLSASRLKKERERLATKTKYEDENDDYINRVYSLLKELNLQEIL